nr:MAG TPA: hypothetical protein [Caudoviricetes sp.]
MTKSKVYIKINYELERSLLTVFPVSTRLNANNL